MSHSANFARREVEHIGWIMGRDGLKPDPKKIEAMVQMAEQIKELQNATTGKATMNPPQIEVASPEGLLNGTGEAERMTLRPHPGTNGATTLH